MRKFGDRGIQTVEGRPSKVSFDDGQEGWCANETIRFEIGTYPPNRFYFNQQANSLLSG